MQKILLYVLALVIILLDQWTKALASAELVYGVPQAVTFFFDLTLRHNPGAAFSFLSDAGGWQRWLFTGIALVVSAILIGWIYRLPDRDRLLGIALALVLGGAIGNVYDRIMLGYVVDFISVHWDRSYFPAFNIADSAISVGAVLLIVDSLFYSGARERRAAESSETT